MKVVPKVEPINKNIERIKRLEKELGVKGTANVFRAALAKAKEAVEAK